jgi:hypothetical protein
MKIIILFVAMLMAAQVNAQELNIVPQPVKAELQRGSFIISDCFP